jgi:hypothetical protein
MQAAEHFVSACGSSRVPLTDLRAMACRHHPEVDVRASCDLPLRCACRNGRLESIKWLVDGCGADATPPDAAPLFMACVGGHLEVAQWLFERHERAGGLTQLALHDLFVQVCTAGEACVQPVARWLLHHMGSAAAITAAVQEAVLAAADGDSWPMVQWLLQQGVVDVHVARDHLLTGAVRAQQPDLVRWLLARDPEGRWPVGGWIRMLQTWSRPRDAWIRSVVQ